MITYRKATPADREATLAVSAHFENDWLQYGFDYMTAAGRFFVAQDTEDDRIVAVCGYTILGGTIAWLQAMRVHPDYHNRGLATEFTLYIMEECRKAGCRVARLDTAIDNHPVHHMMREKLHFHARGTYCMIWGVSPDRIWGEAAAPDASAVEPAGPGDAEAIWSLLARRAAEGRLEPAGLISSPGHIHEVDDFRREDLEDWLTEGEVLVTRADDGPISGVAIWGRDDEEGPEGSEDEGYHQLEVSYLEGEPPVQAALLAAVIEACSRGGPVTDLACGLPESQWKTLKELVAPAWAPEDIFVAIVYDKEL